MQKIIDWTLPIITVSEANLSEHWSCRHKRHRVQKRYIDLAFHNWRIESFPKQISLPCTVIMTRISPRTLDEEDNLRMALKSVKDSIASEIKPGLEPGRADDDKNITWEYAQKKGKPKERGLKIEIYC